MCLCAASLRAALPPSPSSSPHDTRRRRRHTPHLQLPIHIHIAARCHHRTVLPLLLIAHLKSLSPYFRTASSTSPDALSAAAVVPV